MKRAYETKSGLYQHYNKLFIAGTKDFPQDHIDDLKLPFDDTLNKAKRGRDADAYYRSHHEIDNYRPFIRRISRFSIRKTILNKNNNPYGIIQSKTFGAPVVSGSIKSSLLNKKT